MEMRINFCVSMNVTQTISFDENYVTKEELFDGLESGKYFTALDCSDVLGIAEDGSIESGIGEIVEYQFNDSEFTDFELLP